MSRGSNLKIVFLYKYLAEWKINTWNIQVSTQALKEPCFWSGGTVGAALPLWITTKHTENPGDGGLNSAGEKWEWAENVEAECFENCTCKVCRAEVGSRARRSLPSLIWIKSSARLLGLLWQIPVKETLWEFHFLMLLSSSAVQSVIDCMGFTRCPIRSLHCDSLLDRVSLRDNC